MSGRLSKESSTMSYALTVWRCSLWLFWRFRTTRASESQGRGSPKTAEECKLASSIGRTSTLSSKKNWHLSKNTLSCSTWTESNSLQRTSWKIESNRKVSTHSNPNWRRPLSWLLTLTARRWWTILTSPLLLIFKCWLQRLKIENSGARRRRNCSLSKRWRSVPFSLRLRKGRFLKINLKYWDD